MAGIQSTVGKRAKRMPDTTVEATFVAFFQLFITKNAENKDFGQRFGCGAPKCWSKYTTLVCC